MDVPKITLYSSQVSDCSARLRIALNLKGLKYRLVPVSMKEGENQSDAYAILNPAKTIPTLVVEHGNTSVSLTQSVAALEYLEEAFPSVPLLPSAPDSRAKVRSLANIICTDIHPLTAPRVGRAVATHFSSAVADATHQSDMQDWDLHWIDRGVGIYEALVKETCGRYSVGDEITLADVVLVPQLVTGLRYGLELEKFPTVGRIFRNLNEIDDIRKEQQRLE